MFFLQVDLYIPPHLFRRKSSTASHNSAPLSIATMKRSKEYSTFRAKHGAASARSIAGRRDDSTSSASRLIGNFASRSGNSDLNSANPNRNSDLITRTLNASTSSGPRHFASSIGRSGNSDLSARSLNASTSSVPRRFVSSIGRSGSSDSGSRSLNGGIRESRSKIGTRSSFLGTLEKLRRSERAACKSNRRAAQRLETVESPRSVKPKDCDASPHVGIPVASSKARSTRTSRRKPSSSSRAGLLSLLPGTDASSCVSQDGGGSSTSSTHASSTTRKVHTKRGTLTRDSPPGPRNRPGPVETVIGTRSSETQRSVPLPLKREQSISEAIMSLGKGPPAFEREPSLVELIMEARVERAKRSCLLSRFDRGGRLQSSDFG